MIIPIPFGKDTLQLNLPSERVAAVLTPQASPSRGWIDESAVVEQALANPIGTPKLRQLARRAQRVTVITSDHTRPLPSRITLPLLLAEIRAGNPDAAVAILVATGCHRPTTGEEMLAKFGPDLVRNETFIIHDAMAGPDAFHDYGPLPSGAPCRINNLAADCDLLVAEGFIEPHFFAGYSGGRKAVLPGVADQATVLANHSAALIDHPNARAGMLAGNLLHLDMVAAARQANLAFILNVTLTGDKRISAAFAGDMEQAHLAGCAYVADQVTARCKPADLGISSNGGYPLDQNLYQAVKCLATAEAVCNPGGVIIAAAECCDGHGGEEFSRALAGFSSPGQALAAITGRGREETHPDQWQSQILMRILAAYTVIMVTGPAVPAAMVESLGMRHAADMDIALRLADSLLGEKADKTAAVVIPDGVNIIAAPYSLPTSRNCVGTR